MGGKSQKRFRKRIRSAMIRIENPPGEAPRRVWKKSESIDGSTGRGDPETSGKDLALVSIESLIRC
jgi:hypothetical protein